MFICLRFFIDLLILSLQSFFNEDIVVNDASIVLTTFIIMPKLTSPEFKRNVKNRIIRVASKRSNPASSSIRQTAEFPICSPHAKAVIIRPLLLLTMRDTKLVRFALKSAPYRSSSLISFTFPEQHAE